MPATDTLELNDAEIAGLLKRAYSEFRVDTFPQVYVLLAQLEKGRRGGKHRLKWGGEGVFGDAILTRPQGMVGSSAGNLPNQHTRKEKQFKLGIKRLYVTRQIDGLAPAGTSNKKFAYMGIIQKCLQELTDASRIGMQEVAMGDGRGIKALVGTVTNATTITAVSPFGYAGAGEGGMLLDADLEVAVHDGTTSTVRGRARISTISNAGDIASLVLANPGIAGMQPGDAIVACTDADTSLDQYPAGILKWLNFGGAFDQFEEIDASVDPRWNTTRLVAGTDVGSAAYVSETDYIRMFMRQRARSGKDPVERPDEFLCMVTPGLWIKTAEAFFGQRQIPIDQFMNLKGGFKAVRICGVPVVQDAYLHAGCIVSLHLGSSLWIDAKDWGYVTLEGAGPWRWVTQRDAYQTSRGAYIDLGTSQRNAHAMISGYDDTERYSHVM